MFRSGYIVSFLNSAIGRPLLSREFQGNVQEHLGLADAAGLPIPIFQQAIHDGAHALVIQADAQREAAKAALAEAETILLDALGLRGWSPPEPLTYTRSAAVVAETGRLDAEHYQERYYAARRALLSVGGERFVPLGSLLRELTNGQTPLHHDLSQGDVTFLAGEHVRGFEILLASQKRIEEHHHNGILKRTRLAVGDVLLTIKGRVCDAAYVDRLIGPTNINQDVALLRFNDDLPIWYVLSYLNSNFGKMAVRQLVTGAINPFLGLENVRRLPVPVFKAQVMDDVAHRTQRRVEQAKSAKARSLSLLEAAKRAVEIAIEDCEAAALAYIAAQEVG